MSTAVCTVMCRLPMMRAPASGFLPGVPRAQRHQPGHLVLGQPNLLASPFGQLQVGHSVRSRRPAFAAASNACIFSAVTVAMTLSSDL